MADYDLKDISQDDFNLAEATQIDLVRASYKNLDVRKGTVMRELLLKVAAELWGVNSKRYDDLAASYSLQQLEADPASNAGALDRLLSNFLVVRKPGALATGQLMVRVQYSRTYQVYSTMEFTTLDGLVFHPISDTVADPAQSAPGSIPLSAGPDGTYFYFVLPVVAAASGLPYNVLQGTSLGMATPLAGFVTAEAYYDFSGGSDAETPPEVMARLPVAISTRSLESRNSIASRLMEQFPAIHSVSCTGMGDAEQLRDKHYAIAVGGKGDIYVKAFRALPIVTLRKTAPRHVDGTYKFSLSRDEIPGYYAIRAVTNVDSAISAGAAFGSLAVVGSYGFAEVRRANLDGCPHDFDVSGSYVETAYTRYQASDVYVEASSTADTLDFKVEMYAPPLVKEIQDYLDGPQVGNLMADLVVRSPLVCVVSAGMTVYQPPGAIPASAADMVSTVVDYINGTTFGHILSMSQIVAVLSSNFQVSRIDLSNSTYGMVLTGVLRAADGSMVTLAGSELDIAAVASPRKLVTPRTVVFAANSRDMHITVVKEQ